MDCSGALHFNVDISTKYTIKQSQNSVIQCKLTIPLMETVSFSPRPFSYLFCPSPLAVVTSDKGSWPWPPHLCNSPHSINMYTGNHNVFIKYCWQQNDIADVESATQNVSYSFSSTRNSFSWFSTLVCIYTVQFKLLIYEYHLWITT